jgi:cytochrome c oxidase subunit 2
MQVSVFNPASPQAASLLWLWDAAMWVCGFVLAVVTLSLIYILVRFRRRGDAEPDQTTGSKKLEIAWTVIPILLVALLFGLSVMTTGAVQPLPHRAPDILVTGHQWWWEIHYPSVNAFTANEVHIPTGRDLLIGIESADVAHDFWVPRLGPKTDAIPGRRNLVWIRADHPGDYRGFCAEFCGNQHAWMLFRVVAQEPDAYQDWLNHQAATAPAAPAGDAAGGERLFRDLTCANCHNIAGTNSQQQFAPDLTHVASRAMLAGERLKNTPENLRDWLHEPNIIKPGCYMPNLKLSPHDLDLLTAYLETLK